MKRVSFSIGLSDSKGRPIPQGTRAKLCADTYAYLVSAFGGYTVMSVSGGWNDSAGNEYREDGLVFWTNLESRQLGLVDQAASWLAEAWRQEAVMVTVEPIESMRYIGAERKVAA